MSAPDEDLDFIAVTPLRTKTTSDALPRGRRFAFTLILVGASLTLALMAAEYILDYQRQRIQDSTRIDPGLTVYDSELGWRLSPGWSGRHRHHDFDATYVINGYGFRGEAADQRGATRRLYAVVGDSFTFAYGVSEGETFVDRLNQMLKERGFIFYNFGTPGYSTDQELLHMRGRVLDVGPDVVLLVVYLHNDLIDNTLRYPLQSVRGKPYFELSPAGLELRNAPVPPTPKSREEARLDHARLLFGPDYQSRGLLGRYAHRSELVRRLALLFETPPELDESFQAAMRQPLQLFVAIIDAMRHECADRSASLEVVLMPGMSYVERPRSASAQFQGYVRDQLVGGDGLRGVEVHDLATYLRQIHERDGSKLFFRNEGHLNVLGNQVVANYLAARLGDVAARSVARP